MNLQPVDQYRHRLPREALPGMRTDVIVYAAGHLLELISKDRALEQAANVAMLPGIVGSSLAMPDIHQGYGFPIGGVAAMDWESGVVSPGGVGYDINCGVRFVSTNLEASDVRPRLRDLVNQVFRDVPCGTGGSGRMSLAPRQLDEILEHGARWMTANGYGSDRDAEFSEAGGVLEDAGPAHVSSRARDRGLPQVGTLGSGNHFLEIQYVERIHHPRAAEAMHLHEGQVVVMLHCGSRGLGHQVCTDYLSQMGAAMKKYGISLPDRQLACVPIDSDEGREYLSAMRCAANYAWANRQAIVHFLRGSFQTVFGKQVRLEVVYDVCHNIAKRETHTVDGRKRDVLVHRKGATRAFPPGHREIPRAYREIGQPVLIPGSMGTASWILTGAQKAMEETFGSVCHGAGRLLSRGKARQGNEARIVQQRLEREGIIVRSESKDGIIEEVPEAYKDVDEVIEVVHQAGLALKVARLRPMGVIKG